MEDEECDRGTMFTKMYTPRGTKDYLPSEVDRYRKVETDLRESFELWGYREIRSSTIEFIEALTKGVGSELLDNMFKFQDFNGKIVALRAEMTAPVARIVTTRITEIPAPMRLFYISNVFRYSQSYVDKGREFWQAGAELIGSGSPEADGEMLGLLTSSLKRVGLKEIRIDIGHAGLLKDLIQSTNLGEEESAVLRRLLELRDEIRLTKFLDRHMIRSSLKNVFLTLSSCRTVKELASLSLDSFTMRKSKRSLKNLLEISEILIDYGIDKNVFFDFSLTRRIEYYTGIVFEVSVPTLGLPLGGGGRYDNLIHHPNKGITIPATGFAIEIEKCLQALTSQNVQHPRPKRPRVLVTAIVRTSAITIVNRFREAGITALLDITKAGEENTIEIAKNNDVDYVVFVDSSPAKSVRVFNTRVGNWKSMPPTSLLPLLEGRLHETKDSNSNTQ